MFYSTSAVEFCSTHTGQEGEGLQLHEHTGLLLPFIIVYPVNRLIKPVHTPLCSPCSAQI